MEKKSGKPPKPLRLLVNLFNKTKGKSGNGNKNDNAVTAERAKDRNDNGECILLTQPVSQTSASPTQFNTDK